MENLFGTTKHDNYTTEQTFIVVQHVTIKQFSWNQRVK